MDELDCRDRQETGRWADNRVENSHLPFRRRERAMLRFRHMKILRKFASVHANIPHRFSLERTSSIDRPTGNDAPPHWLASQAAASKARHPSCGERFASD